MNTKIKMKLLNICLTRPNSIGKEIREMFNKFDREIDKHTDLDSSVKDTLMVEYERETYQQCMEPIKNRLQDDIWFNDLWN